jgi:hypothetical protein
VARSCRPLLVGAAPAGDTDRTGLLGSYDDKVLRFLQVHHDGEDELMTPLLSECCTAEDAVVVRRVADQHGDVHGPIHDADDALRLWTASANPEAGADFVAALGRLHDALAPHLEDEEAHILPLVAAYLSAPEWGALAEHGLTSFAGDNIWLILGLVQESMTDAQSAAMLAQMTPPAVEAWRDTGSAAFEAFVAAVRATA